MRWRTAVEKKEKKRNAGLEPFKHTVALEVQLTKQSYRQMLQLAAERQRWLNTEHVHNWP
jgi:hypothetical protein